MLFKPGERDAATERIVDELANDERIEAAVITGSLGAGRADRWSDIDLTGVVSVSASVDDVVADWMATMYAEWPVAHHYENAFGSTEVRGFLLADGMVVDLAFTPAADFSVWAPVAVAFDRTGTATTAAAKVEPWSPTPDWKGQAGFAWHDVLHATAAASRGRNWQALFYLQRVRNRTLILASDRRGWDADEFTRVDDLPGDELEVLHATLVSDLDTATLLRAIEVATSAFLAELKHGDPDLADRIAEPLMTVVGAAIAARGRDQGRVTTAGVRFTLPEWPTLSAASLPKVY
jgi:hypothetical protein